MTTLLEKCAFCVLNVLLNNYCKVKKDNLALKIFVCSETIPCLKLKYVWKFECV